MLKNLNTYALMNTLYINRIPAVQFTWDLWRAGSLTELGIKQRTNIIRVYRLKIRQLAVGYTFGKNLNVRPKKNTIAVMFFVKDWRVL